MSKFKIVKLGHFLSRLTGFQVTVKMKVAPSHEVIHLAYLYTKAKQTVVNWLVGTKPSFKNKVVEYKGRLNGRLRNMA